MRVRKREQTCQQAKFCLWCLSSRGFFIFVEYRIVPQKDCKLAETRGNSIIVTGRHKQRSTTAVPSRCHGRPAGLFLTVHRPPRSPALGTAGCHTGSAAAVRGLAGFPSTVSRGSVRRTRGEHPSPTRSLANMDFDCLARRFRRVTSRRTRRGGCLPTCTCPWLALRSSRLFLFFCRPSPCVGESGRDLPARRGLFLWKRDRCTCCRGLAASLSWVLALNAMASLRCFLTGKFVIVVPVFFFGLACVLHFE